jgi:hypothetical protein
MNTQTPHKKMVTHTLDPAVIKRLKAWIARQTIKPPQNAVVERAITNFLDEEERAEMVVQAAKRALDGQ